MNRWIRLHQNALHNPKIVTLSDRQYRAWTNFLLMADGATGALPNVRYIAAHLRMSIPDAELILSELVEVELIDMDVISGGRTFRMHDWQEHQYISDSSAERTRKYRENLKKKTGDGDVTSPKRHRDGDVTPPESESDTDTESYGLSFPTAARKRAKEDQKDLKNVFGMKDDKKERLHARAEGLGLNVEALVAACHTHKAKNIPAYFTSLCVQQLQAKLKGLDEPVIRAALWDAGDGPYVTLQRLLLEAA